MVLRPRYICPPCLRRHYSSLPPLPPSSGFTNLTPTRSLISLHGIDAPKFLQGVTTTNIPLLTNHHGTYSSFLTAQGRVLFDVFIYPTNTSPHWRSTTPTPDDPSFFIETSVTSAPRLIAHIKRYKLRSKFTVRPIPDWHPWHTWRSHGLTPSLSHSEISALDTRAPGFGKRLILPSPQSPPPEDGPEVDATTYKLRRILYGIAEGQDEIIEGVALPQQSNMDYMHGIDFRKGCYVGQELTIRTHHTGVVRTRILPVQLYPLESGTVPGDTLRYDPGVVLPGPPPTGSSIKSVGGRGRSAGKFLTSVGNIGLGLCRLEAMTEMRLGGLEAGGYQKGDEFKVEWEEEGGTKGVKVKAVVPGWHLLGNQSVGSRVPASVALASE